MINFNYELDFKLSDEDELSKWISSVILSEEFKEGDINYIFCPFFFSFIIVVNA